MNIVELPLDNLELRYECLRARRPLMEKRLVASLGETGQQSPVIVVPAEGGKYQLMDGHKRVRALRKLNHDTVKATVWEMPTTEALIALYQFGNGSGWNAVEEGWLVWEFVRQMKMSPSDVCRRLERSKAWVSGRLGLVEKLPEAVMSGVREGKIGSYAATRYFLPFARANAVDCEQLAVKTMEQGFCIREVETLCRYYGTAGREARRKMLEDPSRFLRAWNAARDLAGSVTEEEGRCLKNLELIGNMSLGVARSLPRVAGTDTATAARERMIPVWTRTQRRWEELSKTALMVLGATEVKNDAG
jgi:ParB/RepB/Spo0J family partition protein